jgi:hypothetical protein
MFPPLAEEWFAQVQAQSGWDHFQMQDFQRLKAQYGVTWIVWERPPLAGLNCPYKNAAVQVCRLD